VEGDVQFIGAAHEGDRWLVNARRATGSAKTNVNGEKSFGPWLGWVAVPTVVLKYQDELKLDGVDLRLILQLVRHWWYKDRDPFPSIGELPRCLSVSRSTVQRRLKRLTKLGYIKATERYDSKHSGQTSNNYELLGLAMAAAKFADREIAEREKAAEREHARYTRTKRLSVIG
jgi:DNA-binding transcriptional ArsR family regulator